MNSLQVQPVTDSWVVGSWDEYVQLLEKPDYQQAKGYYYRNHMRLEMSPVGFDHGTDHSITALAINLFAILKQIPLTMSDNCTYRKTGMQECQPDLSCYVGDRARTVPKATNIVSLDRYPAPDLVIEIAKTTLLDDVGVKRSLYEEIGVAEYWVVDVEHAEILAYTMSDVSDSKTQQKQGSWRIDRSQILPGLAISVLEEALRHSREVDQSQVGAWLMEQFQQRQD